jgi:hypothetical protein
MEISTDSVIEVDCHMVGEKIYFRNFFVHLGHILRGLERDITLISVWIQLD